MERMPSKSSMLLEAVLRENRIVMSRKLFVDLSTDALAEAQRIELKPPSMYQVVLLDDDFTPMDFVVDVLTKVFGMAFEQATRIMLQVHTEGRGVCGVYTRDVAETKVGQVKNLAREQGHPLLCIMEAVGPID